MSTDHSSWVRVSRHTPCPVCGKADWCLVAPDGSAAICPRIEEGSVKRAGDAGWLHLVTDVTTQYPIRTFVRHSFKPQPKPRNWSEQISRWQRAGVGSLQELAEHLGVSQRALERLGTGFDPDCNWWTFPERDALGQVIGVSRRDRQGVKKRLPNGRAGLCYADDWAEGSGPVLLVEGASDTAAALTMELCAVGRPSNNGGVDHLIGLLETVPLDREILVIGERDQKPDGRWPGREGAVSTASQLAETLERPIAWSLPPDDAKDTRAWLREAPVGLPTERLADLYLSGLSRTWVHPIPQITAAAPAGPAVELGDWRTAMLTVRLTSLSTPGCYLDGSPTGSGKTNVDLQVLLRASLQEAV